jgi:hypothetical protein
MRASRGGITTKYIYQCRKPRDLDRSENRTASLYGGKKHPNANGEEAYLRALFVLARAEGKNSRKKEAPCLFNFPKTSTKLKQTRLGQPIAGEADEQNRRDQAAPEPGAARRRFPGSQPKPPRANTSTTTARASERNKTGSRGAIDRGLLGCLPERWTDGKKSSQKWQHGGRREEKGARLVMRAEPGSSDTRSLGWVYMDLDRFSPPNPPMTRGSTVSPIFNVPTRHPVNW